MIRHQRISLPPRRLRRGALAVALLLLGLGSFAAASEPAFVEDDPALEMARTQFRERWLVGDHASLARLVAERGAVISLARDERIARSTSPSRAHYLFKSLFLATGGHLLETVAVSAGATGDVVHSVLDWSYLRGGLEQSDRLFVTWIKERSGWRLAELRTGH